MTLKEIKEKVDAGFRVCWATPAYEVVHDSVDQWLIWCVDNDNYIGLTHSDDVTLNGREDQFFVDETVAQDEVKAALALAQRTLNTARCQILEGTAKNAAGVPRHLAFEIAQVQDSLALTQMRNRGWRKK